MGVVDEPVRCPAEFEQHASEILGVDAIGDHRLGIGFGERLRLSLRAAAGFVEGFDVGEHALRGGTEDEGDGVDPMRPDVAHGAEFSAFAGQEAPVVIGVVKEPVLEEVALDMDDVAEVAALHHGAHLEDRGEKAAHVIHGEGGAVFPLYRGDNLGGLARGHAEGFLADDMFAGGEGGERLFDVGVVRRGDVDDIDLGGSQ